MIRTRSLNSIAIRYHKWQLVAMNLVAEEVVCPLSPATLSGAYHRVLPNTVKVSLLSLSGLLSLLGLLGLVSLLGLGKTVTDNGLQ